MTFAISLLSLLLLTACSSDDGDPDAASETESPAQEACEHTQSGPFSDVTAAADPAAAVDATAEHTAVRVALVDVAGGKGGTVTWAADAAGELIVFLSHDVPLTVTTASGDAVAIDASEAVTECSDVATMHVFDAEVGTVRLTFGPTTEALVSIVVEEAGDDHE